jgi:hypothetical protein
MLKRIKVSGDLDNESGYDSVDAAGTPTYDDLSKPNSSINIFISRICMYNEII